MIRKKLKFKGMPIIVDESIPRNEIWMVPQPKPGETYEDLAQRCSRITNLAIEKAKRIWRSK